MKKVFLDTNILVDLIADRKPFSKFSIEIFHKAEINKFKLFTSSQVLLSLFDYLTVIPVDTDTLKKALRSKHKDFEDAIQIVCASSIEKIDCIVTRNIKDFKESEILVLSPDELCLKY